jgi:hypothetical protein
MTLAYHFKRSPVDAKGLFAPDVRVNLHGFVRVDVKVLHGLSWVVGT